MLYFIFFLSVFVPSINLIRHQSNITNIAKWFGSNRNPLDGMVYKFIIKVLSVPANKMLILAGIDRDLTVRKMKWNFQNQVRPYSLISMRPIYYFETWAIICHKIVCWFMAFSPFIPVLDPKLGQIKKYRFSIQDRIKYNKTTTFS